MAHRPHIKKMVCEEAVMKGEFMVRRVLTNRQRAYGRGFGFIEVETDEFVISADEFTGQDDQRVGQTGCEKPPNGSHGRPIPPRGSGIQGVQPLPPAGSNRPRRWRQ